MEDYDLIKVFRFHPVKDGQAKKYEALREKGLELAILVNELCPDSREKSISITKLQEVVMFANASIAINE